jgi:hypothetical protein
MEDDPIQKVYFRPLSAIQARTCINNSATHTCPNTAIQEAVYGQMAVRCCGETECMENAARRAVEGHPAFLLDSPKRFSLFDWFFTILDRLFDLAKRWGIMEKTE